MTKATLLLATSLTTMMFASSAFAIGTPDYNYPPPSSHSSSEASNKTVVVAPSSSRSVSDSHSSSNLTNTTNQHSVTSSQGGHASATSTGSSAESGSSTSQFIGGNTSVAASPSLGLAPSSGAAPVGCPAEGIGAGGSSGGPSGLLVFTWEGKHCVNMVAYEALMQSGHSLAALYVLANDNQLVMDALKYEASMRPAAPAPMPKEVFDLPGFCASVPEACDAGE